MKVITTHLNADFDGLASMIAAKRLYPDALLAFPGSQEKNVRRFIAENLSHRYTFTRIKHIVLEQVDTLIITDTRQASRIGVFAKCLNNPNIAIHLYDHHPDGENCIKGTIESIEAIGSTSTILCQILQKKQLHINKEEATILALGIYEDTGSLTYVTTTAEDLIAVAWLLQQGAQLDIVSQFLSSDLTAHQVSLIHKLSKTARTYIIAGVKVVLLHLTLQKYEDDFSLLVRRFMVMENLDSLFVLVCMDGRIYLIARSRVPEVNAGVIARDFDGGGHDSAASATVRNMTLIEAQERLIRSFHKHIKPTAIASEMLSQPVIAIPSHTSILEANTLLTRYNITVLPILSHHNEKDAIDQQVLGTISRRIVEKAIHHNLGSAPVSDYMNTEIEALPLSATLADIEALIIEKRQRLIPIIHKQQLKGVITRTDLLNMLIDDPGHTPHNLHGELDHPLQEKNKNVLQLMGDTLDRQLIVLLRKIGEVADESGFKAYAVGGFVRDLLLSQKNQDLDIVVEGDGIIFAKRLIQKIGGRVQTHERFITANVTFDDGFKIDIATARLEYYEYPAALPTVELSSIKLDLFRRDFSINAMALQLNPHHFGTLIDFFSCQNDLKNRVVKVLHNLSFVEDPSRILRAIRFEKRMDFKIARHTERLIHGAVKMDLFGESTRPRLFTELQHIFGEENPILAIRRMADFDLFQFLWPDLLPNLKADRRFLHILRQARSAISWFQLLYLKDKIELWIIYLLAIMARSRPRQIESFCERFQIQEQQCQDLIFQKVTADGIASALYNSVPTRNSRICKMLEPLSNNGLLYLMAIARKKEIKKIISFYVTGLRDTHPLLGGNDLKKMGYQPGPQFKTMFTALRNARLDGQLKNLHDEEHFLSKNFPLKECNYSASATKMAGSPPQPV